MAKSTTPKPKLNPNKKPRRSPATRALFIAIYCFVIIFVLVVGFIVTLYVQDKLAADKQQKAYAAAVARCNGQPTITVESHALEEIDENLYTPRNPLYNTYKTAYAGSFDLLGSTFVTGYYCDAISAHVHSPGVTDSPDNYSSVKQRTETYLLSEKQLGGQFYVPTGAPQGYVLDREELTTSRKIVFNYLPIGSAPHSQSDLYDMSLTCYVAGNQSNLLLGDSELSQPAGTNKYNKPLGYAGNDTGETATQYWSTVLPGAACELDDQQMKLTKQQGLDVVNSLQPVDYTQLLNLEVVDYL